jgi:hypothetical protein
MFRLDRLTKEATSPPRVLPPPVLRHIMHAMIDAEDLARRHLHLWQDYLTALMADLREPGCYSSGSLPARRSREIPRRVTPPRSMKPSCPDRQLAPGHTGASCDATTLWLTSRAALPVEDRPAVPRTSRAGCCTTSLPKSTRSELNQSTGGRGRDAHRTERHLTGLEAYRSHRSRRHVAHGR